MRQNLHTHTTFCDGKNTPAEMAAAAMALGMDSLGFSGHSPFPDDWVTAEEDIPRYRAEVLGLREALAGRLEIFLGLEQDCFSPPAGEGWDYLIGSVHEVERDGRLLYVDESEEDFLRVVRRHFGNDPLAFAEAYYRLVGGVAERTGCQIVGHFDLVTKFNEGDRLFDTGDRRYRAAALEALDRLAEAGVILEINTGAMAKGYRTLPYPAPPLLRAARERNIPICVTSDAHSADAMLHGFARAGALARDCGYREAMYLTAEGFVPGPLPGEN